MIDAVSARKVPNCFTCVGIGNLSNFAAVKSLEVVWWITILFFRKQVLSPLFLILSRYLWNFFKSILWLGLINVT